MVPLSCRSYLAGQYLMRRKNISYFFLITLSKTHYLKSSKLNVLCFNPVRISHTVYFVLTNGDFQQRLSPLSIEQKEKQGFAGLAKSLAYCVQKHRRLGFDTRGTPKLLKQKRVKNFEK
jgi:hypothetical protein